MRNLLAFVLLIVSTVSYSQGFLRGKIIDGETGEGLLGATVVKEGTSNGIVTDFDGNYSLTLEAGTHTIQFQFVSYQTQTVNDVVIKDGEVTALDVTLSFASTELAEVVVTAEQIRDSEVAMLTVQKKSANLLDGISTQTFRKLGDNDLGAAMKRVTGVAVQGGKYVYVRGLGDRYTKTTINAMSIPGLDPDNNSVQIDIFPTSTIENVIVYKTFSPNLSGDFTGGMVDVEPKNYPEEKTTNFSVGFALNPDMHFNKNFLSYKGGKTDWLAFDDGTRKLPFPESTVIPDISAPNGAEVEGYTRAFNPQMAAQVKNNALDYNFSFNHGNQLTVGSATVGYNAVLSYRTTYEYYDKVEFGEYFKDPDPNVYNLMPSEVRTGSLGSTDVIWSGLLAGAVKFEKHNFSLSYLRSQNGTSSASHRISSNLLDNPSTLQEDILTYAQRSVDNFMLTGKHNLSKINLEWRASHNISRIYEPDFRSTRIQMRDDGSYDLQVGVGAGIDRFYRDLDETNSSFKVDATIPYGNKKNKLQFGGVGTFKERQFEVLDYLFRVRGGGTITGNADDFLRPENIWTPESNTGTYVRGNYDASKSFDARQQIYGIYIMTEQQLFSKLKAIYGIRAEQVYMYYTGINQSGESLNDEKTLDNLDYLPSVNLVYSLSDDMNFRLSFNKTLARPSFKEKSNAQIFDPISKRTFIGNLDLEETHVDNYDLRWEYFLPEGQMISLSGYYKSFDGHIELVSFETAPDNLKPRNSGKSDVYGIEVEARKNLTRKFSLGANASFVHSAVDLKSVSVNEAGKNEYQLRLDNARTGESIKDTRPMAGQAPYVVNAYVGFKNEENTINVNLAYNVQGETLNIVGSGRVSDIYTRPFNSLNLTASKNFGEHSSLQLGVNNILNAERVNFYKSYRANDEIFSIFRPGTSYSLKFVYSF